SGQYPSHRPFLETRHAMLSLSLAPQGTPPFTVRCPYFPCLSFGVHSSALIEMVRERVDISAVIGRRLHLDGRGRGLCPFHQEKTASFSLNRSGGYFHCFGCGVGGDVFRFIELYEKKSFWESLSELAREAGVSMPEVSDDLRGQIDEERLIECVLTATADFYHQSLTAETRTYLTEERGFTEDTLRRFTIGYADGGLKKQLIRICKFSEALCLKAGVLKQTENTPSRLLLPTNHIPKHKARPRRASLGSNSRQARTEISPSPRANQLPVQRRCPFRRRGTSH
ncbi:MAG TPA: CHC2 zinc finger domain-containing protein, partial [Terriglobia bacterium]|nr:CHC2 zinc finger domain-containing protein [Terriglobia bacterium]